MAGRATCVMASVNTVLLQAVCSPNTVLTCGRTTKVQLQVIYNLQGLGSSHLIGAAYSNGNEPTYMTLLRSTPHQALTVGFRIDLKGNC